MARGLGCLFFFVVLGWLALEVWTYVAASRFLNTHFEATVGSGGYLIVLLWIALSLVVAIKLGRWHLTKVMPGVLNGSAGRHVVGVLGAVLLGLPGLLSDIPGLLLLLPPVQSLLGKLGAAVMAVIVKRSMGKMMGGGFPGGGFPGGGFPGGSFPGGNPFAGGNPFPGMRPLMPDEKARFGKGGKTYETTVEKD
jgi:UPF0716 family protein affecting phage T7 exclusion